jgi:hypothetical protein
MTLRCTYLTGSSEADRQPQDFYPTPPEATQALLAVEAFPGTVWEPACGDGAISLLLRRAPGVTQVTSTDLYDRGYGESGVDFLIAQRQANHVVTNPPYKLAQPFVSRALEVARHKVAMLLKLNFLEGQRRRPFLEASPLRTVYVFSKRLSFNKGNEASKGNGVLAYAWFVWEHGHRGAPQIQWI